MEIKTFDDLINHIIEKIKSTNNAIGKELQKIASKVYTDASRTAHDQKYCLTFNIPDKEVTKLISILDLDIKTIKDVFEKEYEFPKNSQMYGNEYYQILLALYYAYKKLHMDNYAKIALFLILIRIWNGRKYKYIKFCNKNIMEYVLTRKITKRNLAAKYNNPLDLILRYFVETIDQKYGPTILRDKSKLKLLFAQCFNRIDQLFNNAQNTGLANLYFQVHESGEALYTQKTISSNEDEQELTIADIESRSSQIQKIANVVTNAIILSKPSYPNDLVNLINQKTKLSKSAIEILANELHNKEYADKIQEAVIIAMNRLGTFSPEHLCSFTNLINIIDRKLISSKHNKDVEEFKKILSEIADDILQRKAKKSNVSPSVKVAIIRTLAYLIGFNIVNSVCPMLTGGE